MYDDQQPAREGRARTRKIVAAVGLGAVGLVAGGLLAGTLSSASAESGTSTGYGSGGYGAPGGDGHGPRGGGDPTKSQNPDEKLLTGTTKAKVLAAVKKKYPTATVQRVETDSDGVYEAHILVNNAPLTVQVGKTFAITGTEARPVGGHGGPGGPGGPGGHGDHDGDGPAGSSGSPEAPSTQSS